MELIIDFDGINDSSKKDWLLHTLKLMGIGFHTAEKPQTLDEYNNDLEAGNAEIEKGNFVMPGRLLKNYPLSLIDCRSNLKCSRPISSRKITMAPGELLKSIIIAFHI